MLAPYNNLSELPSEDTFRYSSNPAEPQLSYTPLGRPPFVTLPWKDQDSLPVVAGLLYGNPCCGRHETVAAIAQRRKASQIICLQVYGVGIQLEVDESETTRRVVFKDALGHLQEVRWRHPGGLRGDAALAPIRASQRRRGRRGRRRCSLPSGGRDILAGAGCSRYSNQHEEYQWNQQAF